ncbi:tRNA(His) guanylyltransferase isoform X3 [Triticum aestivum]|uniref:tRNA(His) guanylyltransferase isoform X3 n=1 Tax=Triticum aestivum TaxID=4565 RepID=UPI001D01D31D|nr:tRNA(His) guanylyltransferase-like isoform X3 [Triticum aestivum]
MLLQGPSKFKQYVFIFCYCCSFLFQENTELYQRDERLNLSSCSCFTYFYMLNWKVNKELVQPPQFEAEVLCYPKPKILCDYLSWRQAECHNRNQYNTCFWILVKSGKGEGEDEVHEILKGTLSTDKNDLLFQRFRINYNNDPEMFQKGSCTCQQKGSSRFVRCISHLTHLPRLKCLQDK